MKIHNLLHRWCSGVKKYMFLGMFVSGLLSDQSDFMALFMAFNLWIGPGFIFESCS